MLVLDEVHAAKCEQHDLAGKGTINPTAMLLSGAMMLVYLGFSQQVQQLELAIEQVYRGEVTLTCDQGGNASTMEFVEAVKACLIDCSVTVNGTRLWWANRF